MSEGLSPDDTLPEEFYTADTMAEMDALPDITMPDFPVPRSRAERLKAKSSASEEE